ncbi:MAG: SGNH/GDSL hydrolase family protein [Ketobacteraceae bacterium]|nr:SGNH/GDSL hydrolase family protein [Ketobacteraceae bacterium]
MKKLTRLVTLPICLALSGCFWGSSLCEEYDQIPTLDRNLDGEADYRYQVIGDSILAYHNIACKSVGHHIGFDVNDRVLSKAATGAKLFEIRQQYIPPVDELTDYEYVIVNGGLNDIIANKPVEGSDLPACDCNGSVNHEACLAKIDELKQGMADVIDDIQATSDTNIALVTYYPAESNDSFIGACFPYVERLNNSYRDLADQDDRVFAIETYGAGQEVIQKVNVLGRDKYHPTPSGSQQIAWQLVEQLGLVPLETEEP